MAQGVLSFPAQISLDLWHGLLCSRSGSCLAQISLPHHNFDNQISFLKVCCHVLPGVCICFNVLVLVLVTQVLGTCSGIGNTSNYLHACACSLSGMGQLIAELDTPSLKVGMVWGGCDTAVASRKLREARRKKYVEKSLLN